MVSRGMIKEKKSALKPKVKSFKVRVTRDVRKTILEDQRIAGDVEELLLETQVIVKQSSSDCIRFGIVFNIVGGADQDGDVEITAALAPQ